VLVAWSQPVPGLVAWSQPVPALAWMNRWKPALNAFAITFEGRLF
jgi:hypothetical protein